MGWLSSISVIQGFQVIGIIASVIASVYVARNQHLTMKWKLEQNKRDQQKREQEEQAHKEKKEDVHHEK